MTSQNWQIFIVSHKFIEPDFLLCDPGFDPKYYSVLNVGTKPIRDELHLNVFQQEKLDNFTAIGSNWAESEAIFNVYRSKIYQDLDYVGFIQYDKQLVFKSPLRRYLTNHSGVTDAIQKKIKQGNLLHISFETHNFDVDYSQKILADFTQPNTLVGYGLNCYDKIIDDLNEFLGSNFTLSDLSTKKLINLCSCFLVDRTTFEEMMIFFDWVVATRNLDQLDTNRNHRLQGGLAERYFGAFLSLRGPGLVDFNIPHHDLKTINH